MADVTVTNAELAANVQDMVDEIDVFKNEQVTLYTTESDTATVTDGEGNAITVPSWNSLTKKIEDVETTVFNGSPVYATIAEGIAAVADGAQFKLKTDNAATVAYYVYQRVDASNATLIATVPSADVMATKANQSDLESLMATVSPIASAVILQSVPGYLFLGVDSNNLMTDLAIRQSDGQVAQYVIDRWVGRMSTPILAGVTVTIATIQSDITDIKADVVELQSASSAATLQSVPGYLFLGVDSNNLMTDLAIRQSDGQVAQYVIDRWGKRLGASIQSVPGYLFAGIDSSGYMTDLAIRQSDGQVAEFVMKRWATRMASYLDLEGNTIPPAAYGLARMRRTRIATCQLLAGKAVQSHHGNVGDSWTAGSSYWGQDTANALWRQLGFAGFGFVGAVNGATSSEDLAVSYSGSWTQGELGTAVPDNRGLLSGAADDQWQIACQRSVSSRNKAITTAKIMVKGAGTVSYRWGNSGDWIVAGTLTDNTPTALELATFPTVATSGTYAWLLQVKVSAAGMTLAGAYLANSDSGLIINKIACGGSSSFDWYKVGNDAWNLEWRQWLAMIPLDSVYLMLGMNDQYKQTTVSNFARNMKGIVDTNIRGVYPAVDVLVTMQPRTTIANTATFAEYYAAIVDWAYTDGKIATMNLQETFGPDYVNYAQNGNFPLIDDTSAHPNSDGGDLISETFTRVYLYATV